MIPASTKEIHPKTLTTKPYDSKGTGTAFTTILELTDDTGHTSPLLGKAEHGEGSIWLLGGSSHLLAANSGSGELIARVQSIFEQYLPELMTTSTLEPAEVSQFTHEGGALDTAFDVGEYSGKVMLSITAAPHWTSVELDGEPATFESIENLVVIDVGPGSHRLVMKIGETAQSWTVLAISTIGVLSSVVLSYRLSRSSGGGQRAVISPGKLQSVLTGLDRMLYRGINSVFGSPGDNPRPPSTHK